jgi:hypothetical protein
MPSKIAKALLVAFAVLSNMLTFFYVAVSEIGVVDKAVLFAAAVLLNIVLVWNNEYWKMNEIYDKVAMAKLELIAADVEIAEKEMFSSPDSLINLIHEHIKIAMEHLNDVL